MFPIRFSPSIQLRCGQCNHKTVSILDSIINCSNCDWSRQRRFPAVTGD